MIAGESMLWHNRCKALLRLMSVGSCLLVVSWWSSGTLVGIVQ